MVMDDKQDPNLRDFQPFHKKLKSSTIPSEGRFKVPTSNEEMAVIIKGYIPHDSQKSTNWAVRVFAKWSTERNLSDPGNHCLENLVEKPDVDKLTYWHCRYVTEVWRKDGQPNPPKTIQHIVAGLQRKKLGINLDAVKFLNSSQCISRELLQTSDSIYRVTCIFTTNRSNHAP